MNPCEYRAEASGKIILMGEHSVVYNKPAIAIPFPAAKTSCKISPSKGPIAIDCQYYKGPLDLADRTIDGLRLMVDEFLKAYNLEDEKFSIKIETSIPSERGMGSSAAVAVALARALDGYFQMKLSCQELMDWANISEKLVHGNPSGLDAATIAREESLYYIKDRGMEVFDFSLDGYLIVADSGEKGETRKAVEEVKSLLGQDEVRARAHIDKLGELAYFARLALEENRLEKLGLYMLEAHMHLSKLGVSNEKLDQLLRVSMENGALGGKLTGGGHGGSIIALAASMEASQNIREELLKAGANQVWISYLGDDKDV